MSIELAIANPHFTQSQAEHDLGSKLELPDGRTFRYVKAGGSNISTGKLQVAPSLIANHMDMAINNSDGAIGDTSIRVTPGATAGNANIYSQGLLLIVDDTGEGTSYKVDSHAAISNSTEFTVNLVEPIEVALGDDATASLVHNPYNGVQESSTQTEYPVGVPLVDISSGNFGWVQTRGWAPVLQDEAIGSGVAVTVGSSTAGAVEAKDAATEVAIAKSGIDSADGEYNETYLLLD